MVNKPSVFEPPKFYCISLIIGSSFCFSSEPLDEIMTIVIVHYTYFLYLVFTSKPENNVVIGLHEAAGPCQEREPVMTPFGHVSTVQSLFNIMYWVYGCIHVFVYMF